MFSSNTLIRFGSAVPVFWQAIPLGHFVLFAIGKAKGPSSEFQVELPKTRSPASQGPNSMSGRPQIDMNAQNPIIGRDISVLGDPFLGSTSICRLVTPECQKPWQSVGPLKFARLRAPAFAASRQSQAVAFILGMAAGQLRGCVSKLNNCFLETDGQEETPFSSKTNIFVRQQGSVHFPSFPSPLCLKARGC